MDKRKPARKVEFDDIISDAFAGSNLDALGIVLQIHLTLEALLIEMIELVGRPDVKIPRTFPSKTEFLVKRRKIPDDLRKAFNQMNDFRNDIAHIFSYPLNLSKALELARTLQSHGIEFSDSVGHYSEETAAEYYGGLEGVLYELGWSVLHEAAMSLFEIGGRELWAADGKT